MDKILSNVYKYKATGNLESEIMELCIEDKPVEKTKDIPKYKPEELTDDGIPTIETQLKELKVKDEELEKKINEDEEKRYKREMTQRVKCLSLNKMGKHYMTNTLDLNTKDRKKLQDIMWSYNDIEHKVIIEEFNELVSETLDNAREIDYSKLPVYDI